MGAKSSRRPSGSDAKTAKAEAKERRERQTEIPTFDPLAFAQEMEDGRRPTVTPPFDTSSYARIVDDHVSRVAASRDTPRTMTAATASIEVEIDLESVETIGRAMYGSYLDSDFPEALVLAERVLDREPEHALAQVVAQRCRSYLGAESGPVKPSSILRLRTPLAELAALDLDATSAFVVGHLDGRSDAATIAELSGIPRGEALDCLRALLDRGVVEVVNG